MKLVRYGSIVFDLDKFVYASIENEEKINIHFNNNDELCTIGTIWGFHDFIKGQLEDK